MPSKILFIGLIQNSFCCLSSNIGVHFLLKPEAEISLERKRDKHLQHLIFLGICNLFELIPNSKIVREVPAHELRSWGTWDSNVMAFLYCNIPDLLLHNLLQELYTFSSHFHKQAVSPTERINKGFSSSFTAS